MVTPSTSYTECPQSPLPTAKIYHIIETDMCTVLQIISQLKKFLFALVRLNSRTLAAIKYVLKRVVL